MGRPVSFDEMPLQTWDIHWNFWEVGIGFCICISPMSKKKKYILVCTNYVTKWVEAKTLYAAMEKAVVDFLFEDIFTRLSQTKVRNSHQNWLRHSLSSIRLNNVNLPLTTLKLMGKWNLGIKSWSPSSQKPFSCTIRTGRTSYWKHYRLIGLLGETWRDTPCTS